MSEEIKSVISEDDMLPVITNLRSITSDIKAEISDVADVEEGEINE